MNVVQFDVDANDVDFTAKVVEQCSQYIVQATLNSEPLEPIYDAYLALWRRWEERYSVR